LYPAAELLLSFPCVALLYGYNFTAQQNAISNVYV